METGVAPGYTKITSQLQAASRSVGISLALFTRYGHTGHLWVRRYLRSLYKIWDIEDSYLSLFYGIRDIEDSNLLLFYERRDIEYSNLVKD